MEPLIFGLLVASVVSGLGVATGHYIPWELWIKRKLPRLAAYAWGVLCIAIGFVLVADAEAIMQFVASAGSAGFVTVLTWLVDWAVEQRKHRLIAEGTVDAAKRLGS